MIKVLHVTPGLESGGAEMLLSKLVGAMDRSRFENTVVSLTDEGPLLGQRVRDQHVALRALGFRRGAPNPMLVWRLAECMRDAKPDIVQTWLYHGNLIGSLSAALAGAKPLVWGLHKAKFDLKDFGRGTRMVIQANTPLSKRFPAKIVCSSEAASTAHAALGYPVEKLRVIANGIDTEEFRPDSGARESVRAELGISEETPLIGMVARYTKEKDHPTFFRAASLLLKKRPEARFLLCGAGITKDNAQLRQCIAECGVEQATHLIGLSPEPARYTAALDVATCTSTAGESFCLALAEAMACGVPCVTTDLEGPASLVDSFGRIVPTRDPESVANAWESILDMPADARAELGRAARNRIVERFSLGAMVRGYEDLYGELCSP